MRWVSLETHKDQKASAIIQTKAAELLFKCNLRPTDLKGIITVNGPGFYTGLRLSEGFSDVFAFFNIPQFSFYSYEIPLWCGFRKGTWFTKAYRGEYFFYSWDGESSAQKLVSLKELDSSISSDQYFIHSEGSLDEKSSSLLKNPIKTIDLLRERAADIFPNVLKNHLKREAFYFRAPEDEFKANP